MKKHFYLKSLLSLLLLFVGVNAFAAENVTVTKTVNNLVTANSWKVSSGSTIGTLATSFTLDDVVTVSTSGEANCGSVWGTTTYDWRLYQNKNGDVTLSVATGYELVSATFTFTVSNTGTLLDGTTALTSGTAVTLSGSSKTFTVGNSGTKTNGQVKITQFSVTYKTSTKTATTTSFPESTYSAYIDGDAFTAPTATVKAGDVAVSGATVTYSSSATDVATVDASTGAVTLVGPGTTTIQASYAGNDTYNTSSASYTLTVGKSYASLASLVADGTPTTAGIPVKVTLTDETIQSIALNAAGTSRMGIMLKSGDQEVEIYCYGVPTAWEANGTVSGTVTGTWKLYSSTWEICPSDWTELTYTATTKTNPTITLGTYKTSMKVGDADDEYTVTTNSDGEVTVTSSDENVAEAIYESGTVLVSAKAAGTTTITVKTAATATYYEASKSYTLTVTKAATLPFSFDGGLSAISTTTGMSQSGLGSDYSASPKLKFNDEGDYVVVNYNSPAGVLKYSIKGNGFSGGTFDVLESANGTDYTSVQSHTELATTATSECVALKSDSRFVKFIYTNKVNGNVALGKINIFAGCVTTISAAKYATFVAPSNIDFTDTGVTAYAAQKNGNSIHLEPVTTVPSGSAVVVYANVTANTNFGVPSCDDASLGDVTNDLQASATDIKADGTQYVLANGASGVGFYKAETNTTIASGKGYIVYSSGAKDFFGFEDETATGINLTPALSEGEGAIYNLAGQRLAQPQKGINIINGKKYIVK